MKIFKELELLGFFEWLAEMHNLRDTDMKPEYLDELPLNDIHLTVCNSMAFRWFREKHNLHFYAHEYELIPAENSDEYPINVWLARIDKSNYIQQFDTYEEAELACLKKLIEIVKQHKND